jgi:hypothetical protein
MSKAGSLHARGRWNAGAASMRVYASRAAGVAPCSSFSTRTCAANNIIRTQKRPNSESSSMRGSAAGTAPCSVAKSMAKPAAARMWNGTATSVGSWPASAMQISTRGMVGRACGREAEKGVGWETEERWAFEEQNPTERISSVGMQRTQDCWERSDCPEFVFRSCRIHIESDREPLEQLTKAAQNPRVRKMRR